MPQISPGLNSLLNFEPNADRAILEIAKTPVMLEEAKRVLPALRDSATRPAGEAGVYRVIASRRALFIQPERTPQESAAWYNDYYETLEHLPESAIEAAMQAWIKLPEAEFMPKPGKLLELTKTTPNRAIKAYQRCKAAVEYVPPRQIDRVPLDLPTMAKAPHQPTQADKDRVKRMAREFIEADDARKKALKATKDIPPVSAPTDETGVSAGMRELLERQRKDQAA